MGMKNSPVTAATAPARLKREDCGRTKYDSAFSGWKVLVGPFDWEDFSLGKEGAERYRVHNLPRISSPGIYELGIAVSNAKSGRQISKLDPSFIIVVYLGQADCVRTRLQQYGRSGAHLGRDSSAVCPNNCKSSCSHKQLGLFEEILCRGYSVVFRWAPMNNKADALRTEAQLLNTFDYAWNKGCNNARRPTDILQKLDQVVSNTIHISTITRKFLPFLEKKVGIEIKGKLLSSSPGNKDKLPADEESNFLYRIFKVSRTRPRVVVIDGSSLSKDSDSTHLCGISLENGGICRNPPLKGRKRCLDHKGLKINAHLRSQIPPEKDSNGCEASDVFSPVCGFILGNGSSCQNPSIPGRKRCSDHKGQRIRKPISHNSKLKDPVLDTSYDVGKSENQVFLQQCKVEMNNGAICGVEFGDGTYCMRQSVRGRLRCEGHKGMRVSRVKKYTISR